MLPCAGVKLESVRQTLSMKKMRQVDCGEQLNLDSESPYCSDNVQPTTENAILIDLWIILPHGLLTLHEANLGDRCHEVFNGKLNDVADTPRMTQISMDRQVGREQRLT